MKKLTKYFFEGLIVLLPLAATVYLLYWIFTAIDNLFSFDIPGIGLAITLAIVILAGVIASSVFTKGFVGIIHDLFGRLPLIKLIYNSIKDLIEAFVGDKKKFNKPCLVKLGNDVEILGFVTEENLSIINEEGKLAVYIPQAYNFAGNLIVVPAEKVKILSAGAKEVMTFIVSGGLSQGKKDYQLDE